VACCTSRRASKARVMDCLAACGGPDFTGVSASPNALWPPNHRMATVTINYTLNDNCDPAPACSLSLSNNEGVGGHTSPAWIVLDAHHVDLHAERAGTGNGRVCTIAITCQDKLDLSSNTTTAMAVAHDQGKNNKKQAWRRRDLFGGCTRKILTVHTRHTGVFLDLCRRSGYRRSKDSKLIVRVPFRIATQSA